MSGGRAVRKGVFEGSRPGPMETKLSHSRDSLLGQEEDGTKDTPITEEIPKVRSSIPGTGRQRPNIFLIVLYNQRERCHFVVNEMTSC